MLLLRHYGTEWRIHMVRKPTLSMSFSPSGEIYVIEKKYIAQQHKKGPRISEPFKII